MVALKEAMIFSFHASFWGVHFELEEVLKILCVDDFGNSKGIETLETLGTLFI